MKPYQKIPIQECGEPLVAIPSTEFSLEVPHPYERIGAPYGDRSPYLLRSGVLHRLRLAQAHLQTIHPNWRIRIFDAYRPIAVQQFMVEFTLKNLVQSQGLTVDALTPKQYQNFLQQVYQFWAVPNFDPRTPPPHSTGAAVDITLSDEAGPLDLGSPIDELSPRSYPNYFAAAADPQSPEYDEAIAPFHYRRQLLHQVMTTTGFRRHPNEWWHFSYGDQMWAWLGQEAEGLAKYGRVEGGRRKEEGGRVRDEG